MPRRRARLSKRAQIWLEREIRYLAAKSPAAAKKLAMRIRDARNLLTEHPRSAQAGRIHGTRRFVLPQYVLTVRDRGGITEIVAIRHAQQGDAYAPEELLNDKPSSPPSDGRL
jgi:plasmid stabilization system protein ParE